MNIILWDYWSVSPDIWPQSKCKSIMVLRAGCGIWLYLFLIIAYLFTSLWPIFHGPVILPYILKTIWCMYIVLWDYESVWPKVWPQNKSRSLWPIFYGPVILPCILGTILCINIIIWNYESVWPYIWPQNKCRSLTYVHFIVKWFCLISWRLLDVWTSLFGIMSQYDPKFDLKINIGHCDLYFMVQWFCIISWRLFDV